MLNTLRVTTTAAQRWLALFDEPESFGIFEFWSANCMRHRHGSFIFVSDDCPQ